MDLHYLKIFYEVAKEKAINTLNGYIYEIMVRGE